ncbi:MAG: hypothetical protein JWR50_1953 [Mucilaginibacter sp.]|nr:hypothetical protein [Mucilaginibacter sp.]
MLFLYLMLIAEIYLLLGTSTLTSCRRCMRQPWRNRTGPQAANKVCLTYS